MERVMSTATIVMSNAIRHWNFDAASAALDKLLEPLQSMPVSLESLKSIKQYSRGIPSLQP
jgi:exonuclease VII small subunit